jgi:heme-degrading monooxygenase HmoA
MADEIYRYSVTIPGFVSATYVISDDETSYGSFSIWKSKEEAEKGGESIRKKVIPIVKEFVTEPPKGSVMEIYEPK